MNISVPHVVYCIVPCFVDLQFFVLSLFWFFVLFCLVWFLFFVFVFVFAFCWVFLMFFVLLFVGFFFFFFFLVFFFFSGIGIYLNKLLRELNGRIPYTCKFPLPVKCFLFCILNTE